MKNFKELFSAFDLIDEIIYVSDMDTYELVYCNQKTKKIISLQLKEGESGNKCYKCLQGLDSPCVFCNNDELKKNIRCIWTRKHPQTGKYYLIHDAVITVDDKDYRMELAVDSTHIEEAALHTRQMLDMETYLTDCVRRLVKSDEFSDSVETVLQTVLNFYGGERAYLFDFDWEKGVSNNTYETCALGIKSEIDNLQNIPVEIMHFWIDIFSTKRSLIIEDLNSLKEDLTRKDEYEILTAQGINSIIAVPIFIEHELMGFIGVDNPKLNFKNSDFLINLAYFLGVETNKNNTVKKLQSMTYHDPLTGVYNRKGLEHITKKISDDRLPIGFAIVDIDNFKMLNDTYGHDVGDEILKEIANMLISIFRNQDIIFRLGGDEFAVLLYNCDISLWKTICSKIQWVHSAMAEKHSDKSITISAGICISLDKYNSKVYKIADEALYETKRNGRAGCTMIDESTGEKKCWNDDNISSYSKNVLEFNNTGLFKIEYGNEKNPRMICSNLVKEMFAFPAYADPEKCYQLWIEGVEESYREAFNRTKHKLFEGVQAECTYQWNHPIFGKIFVRTSGTGEFLNGEYVFYGYHHSLKDTEIIEREDENKLLLEAISSIYFGSYYINLENDTYFSIKNAQNERFLQVQESSAQYSLNNFVSGLVHPTDKNKMIEFVDLTTLPKRIEDETHLDCEYISVVEKGWCRATFIPVKYDEKGSITNVLFEVSPLDKNNALESEKNARNKKTIESLYNHVPGGLVMYEWNGKHLKTLQISTYYKEQYGDELLGTGNEDAEIASFECIHPDDIAEYKQAIKKSLIDTHHLEYVYRVWNNIQNRYVWVKINAVSEVQPDGNSLIYAMYSDVTGQKEAELSLYKRQALLVTALSASNQLCYEYDPVTHTEECLTEDRVFKLPKIIENYPQSLINMGFIHSEDKDIFLRTISMMENGENEAECKIRLKKDGKFVWYSCLFHLFFDKEKGHNVILISIVDITEHVTSIQNYKARMQMMMGITEDSLSFGTLNLTENTFSVVNAQSSMRAITDSVNTVEELFARTSLNVVGKRQREKYKKLFARDNLIELIKKGQMHVCMDHMYSIASKHIEWVRTCVDMLVNPSNGDVVGVCYSKSIQTEKITTALIEKTLKLDYPLAAVVYQNSGEYYLFNADKENYCIYKQDFWDNINENLSLVVDNNIITQVQNTLNKEKILGDLKEKKEFFYVFDCTRKGKPCRLEVRFNYLYNSHEMILATLRDITDSIIMDRLRNDNERDHLTNLYNRRKTFSVCKKLLKKHPDDQFAMLHFDIRHFRLYNTFFW